MGLPLPRSTFLASVLVLCCAAMFRPHVSGSTTPVQAGAASAPETSTDAGKGLINLDVVVTDGTGKQISGLGYNDFSILDNGQSQKILSFHASDEVCAKPDPAAAIILFIDTVKLPFDLAAFEREEVEKFLRRNGGHLAQPTSVFGLSDTGLWTLARSSDDGIALAAEIAGDRLVFIRRRQLLGNGTGEFADSFREDPAGLKALKALGDIATAERRKPGRKLLVWVGPGWGIGSGADFESLPGYESVQRRERAQARQVTFNTIYWFSTLLREARISPTAFRWGKLILIRAHSSI